MHNARNIIAYKNVFPKVGKNAFVDDTARVVGKVAVGENVNIWYNSVIRGDINIIEIGTFTNIQDNCTLHVAEEHSCKVGAFVTVGHGAILHGCTIANNCLIGMGAVILNGADIGENCIIGAMALIPEKKRIPPNSVVMGAPGKLVRTVTEEEITAIRESAIKYFETSQNYLL